ncbi:MAG: radical SAM protein [SAR324 cluster bacterium]|uniref:Radical SAM protein n=1 Tax=SAR324 cluster bacterium TaxID=2024889 RepID=A0A2A4T6H6_9DELT|nr:MAG: radical SAM protein [SAR324 cluster bacterium]
MSQASAKKHFAPIPSFQQKLEEENLHVQRGKLKIFQINMGKLCNQACSHCHVEAGPKRKEIMEKGTVTRIVELLSKAPEVETVDITGGAPELNPHFRYLVREARRLGKAVLVRCNLTVLLEAGQEDTISFFKEQQVQVISSLPCYSKKNVNQQRGNSVFEKSIQALQELNRQGFGVEGSGLTLNLVYNPGGAFLPPDQKSLELQYKQRLKEDWNIEFNQLFTITNMVIKRFTKFLQQTGKLTEYKQLLFENFNPAAASQVMCTELISLSWDGDLFDCDFNQALDLPLAAKSTNIWKIKDLSELSKNIAFANHCYGCTAGAGSSCGGALE